MLSSDIESKLCFPKVPAEFAETDISSIVKENSKSCLALEETMDDVKTTDTVDATISSPDIGNQYSENVIKSSISNCRYVNEKIIYENVTDACDKVTTESLDSEHSPDEDICWAGNKERSASSPLYVNALPVQTHAQSTSELDDSTSPTISYPRHNPTADVSLAFEMVDNTSAPPKLRSVRPGYVHESELNAGTSIDMQSSLNPDRHTHVDPSGPVKHLSLEYLHLQPSASGRCTCEGMKSFGHSHQTSSSGYLSEEYAKSRYMLRETSFGQQSFSSEPSPQMTHKVRDIGDGYVDVMACDSD